MSLREQINKNPGISATVVIVLIAACIGFLVMQSGSSTTSRLVATQAYYSADDGESYFLDDLDKIYPFGHEGKQAYRAAVFKCDDGSMFVGYLQRIPDQAQEKMRELAGDSSPSAKMQRQAIEQQSLEVKKPGDGRWVSLQSPAATEVMSVPDCEDGSTPRMAVP